MKKLITDFKEIFDGLMVFFKVLVIAIVTIPFLLTIWKYFIFDYYIFEVIPSFFFEIKIAFFAVLLLFYKLILRREVLTILLVLFWINFFIDVPPDDTFEIIAYIILSLGSILAVIFIRFTKSIPSYMKLFSFIPRIHSQLVLAYKILYFPILFYPLYIIFFAIPLTYERANTSEETLQKKNRVLTTRELFQQGICYDNHFMGREIFRNFLLQDGKFKQRLKDMQKLHNNISKKIEKAGLRYIDFAFLPVLNFEDHLLDRDSKNHLILGGRTKAVYMKENDDFPYIAWVNIDTIEVYTTLNSDSNFVVKTFPTDFNIEVIEFTDKRM